MNINPLQADHLYSLAAGAAAAIEACNETDDAERKAGLIQAAEYLTAELRRVTWAMVEDQAPTTEGRIDPALVRAFLDDPSNKTANAIYSALADIGRPVLTDATLTTVDGGERGLFLLNGQGKPLWHIGLDGALFRQEGEQS